MKKLLFFILLPFFFGVISVNAQIITSTNTSEIFYPPLNLPAPSMLSNMTAHVANYDIVNVAGALEKYSVWASNFTYENTGLPSNTLAWRMEDASGTLINEGHIDDIAVAVAGDYAVEVEPVVFVENGETYVLVAYYACHDNSWQGSGHYYNIYRWDPAGLTLMSINQLSTVPRYTRISADAFKTYAMAITWMDLDGIKVKTWHSNYPTPWSPTVTVAGSAGGENPDVSLVAGPGMWIVRVAYTMASVINVRHQDIDLIQNAIGPTLPFIFDDAWATTYYSVPGSTAHYGNYKHEFPRSYFQLAGPMQALNNTTWACVYNDDPTNIRARICNNGISTTINLTTLFTVPPIYTTYKKEFPTLSYQFAQGPYATAIYFGFSVRTGTPNDQYAAVKTDMFGVPVVNGYMQVSNLGISTGIDLYSGIAFPKYNYLSSDLFVTFTGRQIASPGGTHLITKKIPWTDTHFKPTGIEEHTGNRQFAEAYPNPFSNHFSFGGSIDLNKKYSIDITDITGRNVLHTESSLQELNKDAHAYRSLKPGIFIVNISDGNWHQTIKLVKN